MCGRFTHLHTWKQVHDFHLGVIAVANSIADHDGDGDGGGGAGGSLFEASYNVAPTQLAPILRLSPSNSSSDTPRAGEPEYIRAKWGLIPSWAKDAKIGNSLINARGDTVAVKPAFRAAYKARRCVVPMTGFYEWQALPDQKVKQPWYITMADHGIMPVAGLWESWLNPAENDKPCIESFTIITTEPNEMMAKVHNRMPVILDRADIDHWLGGAPEQVAALLKPYPADEMQAWRVSRVVNSPKNNTPECIEPFDA